MKKFYSLFIIFLLPSLLSALLEIKTHILPQQLTANERGTYKISITNDGSIGHIPAPQIPEVEGLLPTSGEQSHSFEYINGALSQRVDYSFGFIPTAPGTYTIPSFTIIIKNNEHIVPATTFTVTQSSTPAYASKSPTTSSLPSNGINNPSTDPLSQFKLQLEIDKTKLFLGEMVPVKIIFHVPADPDYSVTINPIPIKESDAFLDNEFQTTPPKVINIKGQLFHTAAWTTCITPLRTGKQTLQYKLPMLISASPYATMNALLGHPFSHLIHRMGSQTPAEPLSQPLELTVEPLPEPPANINFSGAIGNFKLDTHPSVNPSHASVGDPIVLQFSISGSGNFERLLPPSIPNTANWKIYPPKASFTPSDTLGYSGKKTFEYILIAQKDSITETPSLALTVFDTQDSDYKTFTIPPLPVTLSPSTTNHHSVTQPKNPTALTNHQDEHLEPLQPVNGPETSLAQTSTLQTLKTFFTNPWVYALAAIPAVLISSFYIVKKRKCNEKVDTEDDQKKKFDRAIKSNLNDLEKAFSKNNPERFYTAFQKIISIIASKESESLSQSLTFPEIEKILAQKQIPSITLDKLKNLYQMIDLLKFTGRKQHGSLTQKDFNEVDLLVKELLNRL